LSDRHDPYLVEKLPDDIASLPGLRLGARELQIGEEPFAFCVVEALCFRKLWLEVIPLGQDIYGRLFSRDVMERRLGDLVELANGLLRLRDLQRADLPDPAILFSSGGPLRRSSLASAASSNTVVTTATS